MLAFLCACVCVFTAIALPTFTDIAKRVSMVTVASHVMCEEQLLGYPCMLKLTHNKGHGIMVTLCAVIVTPVCYQF